MSLEGKRVVGEINCGCGRCARCRAEDPRHCEGRTVLGILGRDGAFADLLSLPVKNLTVVPDAVPDEAAVFTEPLAAAFQIADQIRGLGIKDAAVLGDGKLGLLVSQVLVHAGYAVTAVGRHQGKLKVLRRKGIRLRTSDSKEKISADLVVECTGTAAGLEQALEIVRPTGTVILKSTVAGNTALNLAPAVIHEITIQGSRCGRFGPALAALAKDTIEVEKMVHATLPLERGVEAFQRAREPGTLKVLLRVSE